MAAPLTPLAEDMLEALARRRATGVVVTAAGAARAAAAAADDWGAERALLADDPVLDELGVGEALGATAARSCAGPKAAAAAGASCSASRAPS